MEKQVVIDIDDELWARAKSRSAIEMRTLKEWLTEAVTEKLARATSAIEST